MKFDNFQKPKKKQSGGCSRLNGNRCTRYTITKKGKVNWMECFFQLSAYMCSVWLGFVSKIIITTVLYNFDSRISCGSKVKEEVGGGRGRRERKREGGEEVGAGAGDGRGDGEGGR